MDPKLLIKMLTTTSTGMPMKKISIHLVVLKHLEKILILLHLHFIHLALTYFKSQIGYKVINI